MKKRLLSALLMAVMSLTVFAQTEYNILSAPVVEYGDKKLEPQGVLTVGDSLIVIEVGMTPNDDYPTVTPPISAELVTFKEKGGGVVVGDTCNIYNVLAFSPTTGLPVTDNYFGFPYWKDVKKGEKYKFWLVYSGSIKPGIVKLSCPIVSIDEDSLSMDVEIDNSLKLLNTVRRTARPITNVNVRQEPSAQSAIVGRLNANQLVVAEYDKTNPGGFCKVVILSTGKTGYVSMKYLKMEEYLPKVSHGAFTKISDGRGINVKPEVAIKNSTKVTINVNIAGKEYKIPSGKTKTVTVEAGICYVMATAVGHSPYFGQETLQEGCSYAWEFVTKSLGF